MQIALLILVFILSVEAMFWAFSVNRHCFWLKQHPDYDRRLAVPSKVLGIAATITGIFSLSLWIFHVYNFALFQLCTIVPEDYYVKSIVVIWTQISVIHLWGIIARYACIHTRYWPILSGLVSKYLVRRFKLTDLSNYCNSMKKWNEIDKLSEQHRLLVFKFADEMKDLMWTKDQLKRYTYINKAMENKLLLSDRFEVMGLTHRQIANMLRKQNIAYNFDHVSIRSDNEVLRKRKVLRFIDRGIVAEKEVILHVLKSPIFLDGQIIGIIGIGRDISFEVSVMEKIELLFKAGKTEEGIELFYRYKDKFMSLDMFNKEEVIR